MRLTRNLVIGWLALGSFLVLSLSEAVIAPRPFVDEPAARVQPAAQAPSAATVERVTRTILPYVEGEQTDDTLIEIQAGVWIKSSNYRGVTIDDRVYYYAIIPHQSFDPLSRGAVAPGAVEIVTEIHDGDFTIVIYRVINDATREPERARNINILYQFLTIAIDKVLTLGEDVIVAATDAEMRSGETADISKELRLELRDDIELKSIKAKMREVIQYVR